MRCFYVKSGSKDDGEQLRVLNDLAQKLSWDEKPFAYIDSWDRSEALVELQQAASKGSVTEVMVASFDRLAGSLHDLLAVLTDLDRSGCAVVSAQEGFDTNVMDGSFMMRMIKVLVDFEKTVFSTRVRNGLARVAATGVTSTGNPIGRPVRELTESELLRVSTLLEKGASWRAIAEALNIPRRTLQRRARQEKPIEWLARFRGKDVQSSDAVELYEKETGRRLDERTFRRALLALSSVRVGKGRYRVPLSLKRPA